MSKKILHVGICDKFLPPFIDFVRENFGFEGHEFMLSKGGFEDKLKSSDNIKLIGNSSFARRYFYLQMILEMHLADKIILHGLFDKKIVKILFYFPWLLKKCYWIIWGQDLYAYNNRQDSKSWRKKEFYRRLVIKNLGYIVCYTTGEYELARKWYSAKAEHIRCFCYLSNLYTPISSNVIKKDGKVTFLIGNSADPSNNHFEVFEKIAKYANEDIVIYTPLTYGNKEYADKVIKRGRDIFGSKFKPLTDHMTIEVYNNFLSQIDIGIFNHNRQQAMGNIRTLLGMGKKVHMRDDLTSSRTLHDDGIKTFTLDEINLNPNFVESKANSEKIQSIFSVGNLKVGLKKIFD